ncbi:uncharacterized protein [Asterias amurensis]|uniref:uncharacterized protein n=1 Tax=Asterias amurensis TaxID=7602 RepID=UPI003AB2EFD5
MAGCCLSLVLLLTLVIVSVSNGTFDGLVKHTIEYTPFWCVVVDFVLTGNVYKNETFPTQKICKRACRTDPKCISINFQLRGGQCEFSSANHANSSGGLSGKTGWIYIYNSRKEQICAAVGIEKMRGCKGRDRINWPSGVYGLPTPTSGCPTGVIWETGSRYQDTEDTGSYNYWYPSTGIHLLGPYGKDDMTQNFCMKTRDHTDEAEGDWPQGRYCVFKYGPNCPKMMSSGFIFWDDEDSNNHNEVQGTVPSGVYDQDTLIYYCCMTDGDVSQPISLPTQNPFYLFPYNSEQCQTVQGMEATQEYFRWDEQDYQLREDKSGGSHPYLTARSTDTSPRDNIVHYCYYEAIESLIR